MAPVRSWTPGFQFAVAPRPGVRLCLCLTRLFRIVAEGTTCGLSRKPFHDILMNRATSGTVQLMQLLFWLCLGSVWDMFGMCLGYV